MKRFTAKMIKDNMYGKGLHDCIKYLNAMGITKYNIERNSKGHPVMLYFMLNGTGFAGYCKAVTFNKNSGLCDTCYC